MTNEQLYFVGIDIGSATSKGILRRAGKILAQHVIPSGIDYRAAASKCITGLAAKASINEKEINAIGATGIGGDRVPGANEPLSDIVCCARGINFRLPMVRTVIDFGEQNTRVLKVSPEGRVTNFNVSEKCAAGSGRFLKVIANVLQINLQEVGSLSLQATNPIMFSTGCAVFGETEAISAIADGATREDILAGVHISLASKIAVMVEKMGLELEIAISGGGGLDIGLIRRIEEKLGTAVIVPVEPLTVTALGAAIIAEEKLKSNGNDGGTNND